MIARLYQLFAQLRACLSKRRLDDEFEAELHSHIQMSRDENLRRGMSQEDALRSARLRFGSPEAARELQRDARSIPWLDEIFRDIRFGLRMISKHRWFSAVAVISLAIGIGANLTAFGITRAILWQTLPVPNPDRLIALYNIPLHAAPSASGAGTYTGLSYPEYEYFRDHNEVLETENGLATYVRVSMDLGGERGNPEQVAGELVSSNFFAVLGVRLALGRPLSSDIADEVVLSNDLWRRRFAADPNIVGNQVRIDGRPFTVIGVADANFRGVLMDWLETPQLWIPFRRFSNRAITNPQLFDMWIWHAMMVVGRMKPEVSFERAAADLKVLDTQMSVDHPERVQALNTLNGKYESILEVLPLQRARFYPAYRASIESYLYIIAVVMSVMLGISCLNLANMMIARATTRSRELALRMALGAGRARLLRQLIIESCILSIAGGIGAFLVAEWIWRMLPLFGRPFRVELPQSLSIDWISAAFIIILSIATGLLFGTWPAWRASAVDVNTILKQDPGRRRLRGVRVRLALVAAEIAAAVALLVCAGLLARTVHNANSVDRFADRTKVGIAQIEIAAGTGLTPDKLSQFVDDVRNIPGVEAAGLADDLPGSRGGTTRPIEAGGTAVPASIATVSKEYFSIMGMPLLRGRVFSEHDGADSQPVAIISEGLARRLWPAQDPIGREIRGWKGSSAAAVAQVIGIVPDIHPRSFRDGVRPVLFLSARQFPPPFSTYLIFHSQMVPKAVYPVITEKLHRIDPDGPLIKPASLQEYLDASMASERLAAALAVALSLTALGMIVIGLYGIISFSVAARRREIGVRIAIGAQHKDVIRTLVFESTTFVLAGLCGGLLLSATVTRYIAPLLFGVTSFDLLSFSAAPMLILITSVVAAVLPAWKICRTDPSEALRCE